jgi:hypothetical protein
MGGLPSLEATEEVAAGLHALNPTSAGTTKARTPAFLNERSGLKDD